MEGFHLTHGGVHAHSSPVNAGWHVTNHTSSLHGMAPIHSVPHSVPHFTTPIHGMNPPHSMPPIHGMNPPHSVPHSVPHEIGGVHMGGQFDCHGLFPPHCHGNLNGGFVLRF